MATFDAAALCLPFTLPQADVRRTYLDSLLSVGRVATGQPEWEIAAGTATLGSEADMGVAGGLGSGSAQGNKTRAIPTSKYKTADSNAAEAVAPPLIRSLSTDAAGDSLVALLDPATLLADAMLLHRTPGYRRHLAAHLPELHAGLVDRRREEDDDIEQTVLGLGSVGAARAGGSSSSDGAGEDDEPGNSSDAPMLPWWLVGNVVSLISGDEEGDEDADGSDGLDGAAAGGTAAAAGGAQGAAGSTGLAGLVPDGGISMRPGGGRVTATPRPGAPAGGSALAAAAAGLPRTAIGDGGGLTRTGLGSAGLGGAGLGSAGFGADDIEADNAGDPLSGAGPVDDAFYLAQLEAAMGSLPVGTAPAPAQVPAVGASAASVGTAASALSTAAPSATGSGTGGGTGAGAGLTPAGRTRPATVDVDLMESLLEGYAAAPTAEDALAASAAGGGLPAVAARAGAAGGASAPGTSSAALAPLALPAGVAPSSASGSALQRQWAVTQAMSEAELRAAEATFTPVRTWPFPLDAFQRQSIAIMEAEGPAAAIFVAAHTSAGKTLVAEYAMSLAIAHRSKAVYTSPIKALSNQKYHDLRAVYGGSDGKGVGIITGDVSINGDAPCVIMTTEILRSMLYRGDPMIQEIEWAIFDEIHYMNDQERGLAYEEVLLLLPRRIGLIFLSATSPNKEEFAEWVGRVKRKRVHVLSTLKRPVPLSHHLFVCNSGELTLIMDGAAIDVGESEGWKGTNYRMLSEKLGAMREKNKARAGATAAHPGGGRMGAGGAGGGASAAGRMGGGATRAEKQTWVGFCSLLGDKGLLPAIIFCFSKKKCEEVAFIGMQSVVLTNARERGAITRFFDAAVHRLSPVDRDLPQITRLRTLLQRGVGVHHSGLLPMMKEVVEMLFSRGLIKLLIVTETFAMGVSMPTRAVIFNGIRKHDGERWRPLTAGEYTQMAGRSGRRGLDTRGVVIVMAWGDFLPDQPALREMMMGKPTLLKSQFRLTYNMILNVMRTDLPVTSMMARSYAEFASGSQRSLAGRDVTALLADAGAHMRTLEAAAAAELCIRPDADDSAATGAAARAGAAKAAAASAAVSAAGGAGGAAKPKTSGGSGAGGPVSAGSINVGWALSDGPSGHSPALRDVEDAPPNSHSLALSAPAGSGGALALAASPANMPAADAFLETIERLRRAHVHVIRSVIRNTGQPYNARVVNAVLPFGRVIVVDKVTAPVPTLEAYTLHSPSAITTAAATAGGAGSEVLPLGAAPATSGSTTPGTVTLWGCPAVVLGFEPPSLALVPGSPAAAASAGTSSSSTTSVFSDALLTVAVILPAGYLHATEPPKLLNAPAGGPGHGSGGSSPAAAAGAGNGGGALVARRRGGDDSDDEFSGFSGKKGGAGKGGGGKASGGRGGATAGGGRSGGGASTAFSGLSRADRGAYYGVFHRINIGGSGVDAPARDASALRTIAVMQVPLSAVALVTPLVVPGASLGPQVDIFPALLSRQALLARNASLQALERLTGAAWELLFLRGATDSADGAAIASLERAFGDAAAAAAAAAAVAAAPQPSTVAATGTGAAGSTAPAAAGAIAPKPLRIDLEFGHAYCLKPLDPFVDVRGIGDIPMNLLDDQCAVGALHGRLTRLKCGGCERLAPQLRVHRAVRRFRALLAHVRRKFSVEALALYPEMRARFRVLRRLGYTRRAKPAPGGGMRGGRRTRVAGEAGVAPVDAAAAAASSMGDNDDDDDDDDGGAEGSAALALMGDNSSRAMTDVVALKGRIAAEVNTADELIFSEMVFEGVLSPLSPAEAAALLSVLVFQDRGAAQSTPFPPVSDAAVAIGLQGLPSAADDAEAARLAAAIAAAAGIGEAGAAGHVSRGGEDADDEDEGNGTPAETDGGATPATPVVIGAAGAAAGGAGAGAGDGFADDDESFGSAGAGGAGAGAGSAADASADDSEAPAEMGGGSAAVVTVQAIPVVLARAFYRLQEIALALGRVQEMAGIEIIPTEYAREALNHGLLLVTYAWACGMPFKAICELTDVSEGVIVRTITRLDETCRECRNAARILGDPILYRKMEAASACIKRDIVFANSLYLE